MMPGQRRPIKVLYVIGTLDVGGTERQLVELVTRLDPQAFIPVVFCLSSGGALEAPLKAGGIRVQVVGFRGFRHSAGVAFAWRLPAMMAELIRLVRLIRAEAPDVVHGLLFWAYVIGAFTARAAGVPVVIAGRRSLGIFKAAKPHYRFLEQLANRMTDLVIANSEAVRRDAIREEGLPGDKVVVIPNGLDLERFAAAPDDALRRSLGVPDRRPIVGVVANFIHYKGHRDFLQAWADVVKEFPRAAALLVGEGPLRAECEAQVAALRLDESVRFLGSRDDVPALLALMDLVAHPSLEEGFSNAILEAMAAGKPVVAANVGGNPEAVVDGETGLLVPPRDSAALAGAILRLLRHPEEAARLGEAGRRRVAEHFLISSTVQRYEAVYERLVAEKAPQRAAGKREEQTARVH